MTATRHSGAGPDGYLADQMRYFIFWIAWLIPGLLPAQDLHFSQFNRNPSQLNPALVGAFRGDVRASTMLRSQWSAVPVPYLTTTLLGDAKIKDFGDGVLGGGVQIDYDRAGDGHLSWLRLGASVGYTRQLSDALFLSAGGQLLFLQRSVDASRLTFAEQFNGDVFDPTRPGELAGKLSAAAVSGSAGLNLHVQRSGTRTKFDFGAAAFHLNTPTTSFPFEGPASADWPLRLNGYGLVVYQLTDRLDFVGQALYQRQRSYQEALASGGVRYHLRTDPDQELSLQLTIGHRIRDAVIPAVELRHRMFTGGVSYDINVSGFDRATGGRGGPELFFLYILTRVKPPTGLKTCPIF